MKYLSDKVIEFINGGSMKVQTYLLYVPIQTVDLNMNGLLLACFKWVLSTFSAACQTKSAKHQISQTVKPA